MISYVADVQQVVGSERVLTSGHPLLYVGGFPVVVRYGGPEANILQSAGGISSGQPFGAECRATGRKSPRSGFTIHIGIAAQSRSRRKAVVQAGSPWRRLRKSIIGTLAVEVGHIEDPVTAADHKVLGGLNGNGDVRSNVIVGRVVKARVIGRAENQFAGIEGSDLGADGILRREAKRILRIVTLRGRSLDFVAETQGKRNPGCHLPAVLNVPTEEVLIGGRECLEQRAKLARGPVAPAAYAEQEGGKTVSRSRGCVIRIGARGRRGLEVERGLAVVAAVNAQPHVRETESQFVPTFHFREIN